ncbi:hypothetical protein A1O7_02651 [Cladophialophora yegresii CBS 114405]|uniref:Uncharacterized protein n=1 Tax=Cladophialophora yegresii CBS 114405 TaxID=1182544 RepID=W9W2M8_9EURO|nr:uncharacterized protein A1O7_02651 [Cladophialophora yegresii CBS 114405]EXJ62218.1 hypothetical protein A1O7_02651 [Cladophialophora yegresii CBS 114405]
MPSDHNPAISDSLLATGNLDASLGELADRFTALDLPLPQHLVAAIRARAKQAHGIYFCSNSSNKSYAGHADAQECMPEAQIADFVRRSHQDLFERLNQMPLESSHLAGDEEEAMEDINKSAISKSRNVPSITNVLAASENVVLLANNEHQVPVTQGIAVNERANEAEPLDIDCPSEPDTALQAEDQPLLRKHIVRH